MANFMELLAIERNRAKVDFQHTFLDIRPRFYLNLPIPSPAFYARNIAFYLELGGKGGDIICNLAQFCIPKGVVSFNVKFHYFLITPSKTTRSEEFSHTFQLGMSHRTILNEIFPGEEILVDGCITLGISLCVEEPEGIVFKPLTEKLRQSLQIVENQVQNDAFASLLESGDFSDVSFVVNEDSYKIKAHKTILAARSPVFATMLTSDMKEAKDNEIRIDDMGATSLQIMLRHIYTGQLGFPKGTKIDLKICMELVNAGEKYNFQNLKEYAAMVMIEFVTLENAWELLKFAKRLEAEAATKALASYCVNNVHKIIEKL